MSQTPQTREKSPCCQEELLIRIAKAPVLGIKNQKRFMTQLVCKKCEEFVRWVS